MPIEIVLRQQCIFKAKDCKICGRAKSNAAHSKRAREDGTGHPYARTHGCAKCGLLKKDREHLDVVPSLRMLGSGNQFVYQNLKKALQAAFIEELDASGLDRGLQSVVVEGEVTIGDSSRRDEGNVRFFIEKALGDALVEGGWIPDDSFYPVRHYSFGGLQARHDPNVVGELRLMIFPSWSPSEA